ncbi:hypothetical protein T265_15731, partial [Opisthorchis viverrini]
EELDGLIQAYVPIQLTSERLRAGLPQRYTKSSVISLEYRWYENHLDRLDPPTYIVLVKLESNHMRLVLHKILPVAFGQFPLEELVNLARGLADALLTMLQLQLKRNGSTVDEMQTKKANLSNGLQYGDPSDQRILVLSL